MNSWLVWTVFAAVAVMLGAVGYHFSLRTLRWVALIVALATAVYLIVYGLTHAPTNSSLSDGFALSADALSSALMGHRVPAPGRIAWLVIVVLLVLGYRGLEAWTLRRQAPSLDCSELTSDRQDNAADAQTGKQNAADAESNALTGKQRHDWLVAELKFRLPAVEVRTPAIFPGGSRPSGLASIAEATGVSGAGLAGAIIRFFGMVWPSPRQIQVRVWVERTPGQACIDCPTRVTVGLADPRSGARIATKTLAARSLDEAVAAVAGFVARHIFARDCTVPPWCASATDGADLAALLRARQVRGYPEIRSRIRGAWKEQIKLLQGVAQGNLCAGVVRYELAQLYDLTDKHVEALLLHAANREQYPRFYRGRYRLAMCLEMLANPHSGLGEIDMATLKKALQILDRCWATDVAQKIHGGGQACLTDGLRYHLLAGAQQELQEIQRYLTWRHIIWGSLRYRNERAILTPYLRLRHRQAFHDGVCVALLLVAIRQALLCDAKAAEKLSHAKTIARIAAAISGDSEDFTKNLCNFPARTARQHPMLVAIRKALLPTARAAEKLDQAETNARIPPITRRLRTRRWPWQCRTPSWPAAYNLACAYAALAADANAAPAASADTKTKPDPLVTKVIRSLEFALCNPECEMERPSEWIRHDPDFNLCREKSADFRAFLDDQRKRDYPAGEPPRRVSGSQNGDSARAVCGSSPVETTPKLA